MVIGEACLVAWCTSSDNEALQGKGYLDRVPYVRLLPCLTIPRRPPHTLLSWAYVNPSRQISPLQLPAKSFRA